MLLFVGKQPVCFRKGFLKAGNSSFMTFKKRKEGYGLS